METPNLKWRIQGYPYFSKAPYSSSVSSKLTTVFYPFNTFRAGSFCWFLRHHLPLHPGAPSGVEGRRGAAAGRGAAEDQGREGRGQGAESGGAEGPRNGDGKMGGRGWSWESFFEFRYFSWNGVLQKEHPLPKTIWNGGVDTENRKDCPAKYMSRRGGMDLGDLGWPGVGSAPPAEGGCRVRGRVRGKNGGIPKVERYPQNPVFSTMQRQGWCSVICRLHVWTSP